MNVEFSVIDRLDHHSASARSSSVVSGENRRLLLMAWPSGGLQRGGLNRSGHHPGVRIVPEPRGSRHDTDGALTLWDQDRCRRRNDATFAGMRMEDATATVGPYKFPPIDESGRADDTRLQPEWYGLGMH